MIKDILVVLLVLFTVPIWLPLVLLIICGGVALVLYLVEFILLICAMIWYPFMRGD